MTIDLGGLGRAMYFSTAARKQQMDMDREQGQIVAEQQQNEMRSKQMQQEQDRVRDFATAYSKQVDSKASNSLDQNMSIWGTIRDVRGRKGDSKGVEEADAQVKKLEETKKATIANQEKIQKDLRDTKARVGDTYSPNNPDTVKAFASQLYDEGYKPEQIQKLMSDEKFVSAKQKEWHDSALTAEQRQMATDSLRKEQDRAAKEKDDRDYKVNRDADARADKALAREEKKASLAEKQIKVTAAMRADQRVVNAAGSVNSALETLKEFSAGTTVGVLPYLTSKGGMINAVKTMTGTSLSSEEADMMNTLFAGIGRDLAQPETGGVATGLVGVSQQLQEKMTFQVGESPRAIAFKLADIKRIVVEHIKPSIAAKILTGDQAIEAQKQIDEMEKLIPYSTKDVVIAARKESGATKSLGEVSQETVQKTSSADDDLIKKYLKK